MDNHFVPEFYFAPWLDERGHLVQFGWRPRGLVADLKTPGQICYQRDLHTLSETIRPEKRDAVEHWLTKVVDTQAAPVIKKLLSTGIESLNSVDASHVVRLIFSLIVRRPESVGLLHRTTPDELMRNMAKEDEAMRQELHDAGVTDSVTLLEYANKRHPGLVENSGKLMMCGIVANKHWGERLIKRNWWTMDYAGTSVVPQIASDRGVTCLGTGLDDPNAVVILPLSPDRVLYITGEKNTQPLQQLGKGRLGLETIKAVAADARRNVFGRRETNENLVRKYLRRPT